jgi:hypothetical protein
VAFELFDLAGIDGHLVHPLSRISAFIVPHAAIGVRGGHPWNPAWDERGGADDVVEPMMWWS